MAEVEFWSGDAADLSPTVVMDAPTVNYRPGDVKPTPPPKSAPPDTHNPNEKDFFGEVRPADAVVDERKRTQHQNKVVLIIGGLLVSGFFLDRLLANGVAMAEARRKAGGLQWGDFPWESGAKTHWKMIRRLNKPMMALGHSPGRPPQKIPRVRFDFPYAFPRRHWIRCSTTN
jgi:hypothetical protein